MTERPHYHGHRQRLKARLLEEPRQLADYEVLECLLGYVFARRDTKPLAKELLQEFGSLRDVLQADAAALRSVKGCGPGVEVLWALLRELRARFAESPVQSRVAFTNPRVVADLAMARLGSKALEEFWLALVDNKNRLMGWEQLSQGTVDHATVYPRAVLGLALERKASGIIMVHNHPGGDPRPSKEDVAITQRISRVARDLGVRVIDHLIVAERDFFSFSSQGML